LYRKSDSKCDEQRKEVPAKRNKIQAQAHRVFAEVRHPGNVDSGNLSMDGYVSRASSPGTGTHLSE
jgi:hypothetical protein